MMHPHLQIALADATLAERHADARRRAYHGRALRREYSLPIVREIPRSTPLHDDSW